MKKMSTQKIAVGGMLVALCLVVALLVRFPLVPAVAFLHFDGKDTILAIASFLFGPGYAFFVALVSSVLETFVTGATPIDLLMNVISSASFVCVAGYIYKRMHTRKGAFIGLAAGTVCQIVCMLVWNYILDPVYFQIPRPQVLAMLPWIALFNLIKCGLNSGITLFIYKPVVSALRSHHLAPESTSNTGRTMTYAGLFIAGTATIAACCLLGLF